MMANRFWEAPLLGTPFHDRLAPLNRRQAWDGWNGFLAATAFDDVGTEHTAIRNAASVYDISPMVKVRVTGPDAGAFCDRLTVRDVTKLSVGGVQYTAWCDDDGHLIDDGTLFRLGRDDYRLCCQERHLPWLHDSALGLDVALHDETEEVAALSLQGPCAFAVLDAMGLDVGALKPFRTRMLPFAGGEVLISRTGFTGDLGYELWASPDLALPLWDRLFEAGAPWGVRAIGSQALDVARVEAGLMAANVDFVPATQALREDRARSPLEMGLGWLVAWDKGHFTGRRALLAERERGGTWAFVGLDVAGNVPADGAILYREGREAGVVTSACWSPTVKKSIAMAQVRAPHADARDLQAEIYALREGHYAKLMVPVRVAPRPFFAHPRRRATPPGRF